MNSLWLWVLVARTVYANAGYEYFDSYDDISQENYFTYSDDFTHCLQNGSHIIYCNTTLTGKSYKQYASIFSAPFPRNGSLRIAVNCISCDLETFPNEILATGLHWYELDFTNSNLKHLKMNALDTTVANTIFRLRLNNNSITHLDDESFPTSDTIDQLDLSHNLIANVTNNMTFSKMAHLGSLNLAYNRLTHLDAFFLSNLTRLFLLRINNNRLVETSFICRLTHVTHVTLSSNPIVNLGTNTKDCSIGARTLILVNGSLQTIVLSNANKLILANFSSNHLKLFENKNPADGQLTVLDLYDNQLQAINLGDSIDLEVVNLARNNFTNTLNISLPITLEELNLSHNKFGKLGKEFLKYLDDLRKLYLAHCGLIALDADAFKHNPLKFLDLSHNLFVTLDLKIFNRKYLEKVNLNGNRLTDINIELLNNSTQLGISNNDWNCTRLQVIVDILHRRNGIVFFQPCDRLTCKANVDGIACRTDEAAGTALEVYVESNEADERFSDDERIIWQKVEANLSMQYPGNNENQALTKIVHEINHDLINILKDIRRQRILKNSENDTDLQIEPQNINVFNHTLNKRFRNITERVECLRGFSNGILKKEIKNTHHEEPEAYQANIAAIVLIVIGILGFVAASAYFGVVYLRKRRVLSYNYVANYSEGL